MRVPSDKEPFFLCAEESHDVPGVWVVTMSGGYVTQGEGLIGALMSAADAMRLALGECQPGKEHVWTPERRHDAEGRFCGVCETWERRAALPQEEDSES